MSCCHMVGLTYWIESQRHRVLQRAPDVGMCSIISFFQLYTALKGLLLHCCPEQHHHGLGQTHGPSWNVLIASGTQHTIETLLIHTQRELQAAVRTWVWRSSNTASTGMTSSSTCEACQPNLALPNDTGVGEERRKTETETLNGATVHSHSSASRSSGARFVQTVERTVQIAAGKSLRRPCECRRGPPFSRSRTERECSASTGTAGNHSMCVTWWLADRQTDAHDACLQNTLVIA